jgi:hypothetical protein
MTTRHVSAEGIYPFYNTALDDAIKGILDIYLVVMGEPDSLSGTFETDARAELIEINDLGTTTRFRIQAYKGFGIWDFEFIVPNTGTTTGQVSNNLTNDSIGTFLYNTDLIYTGVDLSVNYELEPSRVAFHTEQVNSIVFQNICRQNGVEDPTQVIDVIEFTDVSPFTNTVVIPVEAGYNTTVSYDPETDTLAFTAEQGTGKGASPDYGDVNGCGSSDSSTIPGSSGSSSSGQEGSFVRVINGLTPIDGDIPINVSQSLSLNIAKGRVEIIVR